MPIPHNRKTLVNHYYYAAATFLLMWGTPKEVNMYSVTVFHIPHNRKTLVKHYAAATFFLKQRLLDVEPKKGKHAFNCAMY